MNLIFALRSSLVLILSALFSIGCGGNPSSSVNRKAPAGTGFKVLQADIGKKDKSKYSVFVPFNYDANVKSPAIVFLHGLFEGGSDGVKNTTVGLGPIIAKDPKKYPYIILFVQTGGGGWTSDREYDKVIAVLDDASRRYSIDPDRVTLTGLSTGGRGVWGTAAKYPTRFAALVPICGYEVKKAVEKIKSIPTWAFHNRGDPFVNSSASSNMVKWIKKAGGNAKVSLYGAVGHDAWSRAYRDKELWTWIASQRRPAN